MKYILEDQCTLWLTEQHFLIKFLINNGLNCQIQQQKACKKSTIAR